VPGADDLLIRTRRTLLAALDGLAGQRDAIILVGAQAVYRYTGVADVPIATSTKDSDLAVDPTLLEDDPLLERAMTQAGSHRNLKSGQPGEWLDDDDIPVDLLVPETLVSTAGSRGARIPPHSKHATRKVRGLEAAVVDHRVMSIGPLDEAPGPSYEAKVAGPAALTVAKLHKLGEREAKSPGRLLDKDAHDLYRLLRAVETEELADGYRLLLVDARSREVTQEALRYLEKLFGTVEGIGAVMAGRAEQGVPGGDPATVAAAVSALAGDLIALRLG
jgi:hypothetical protein